MGMIPRPALRNKAGSWVTGIVHMLCDVLSPRKAAQCQSPAQHLGDVGSHLPCMHRQLSESHQHGAELFHPSAPAMYFHLTRNKSEPEGSRKILGPSSRLRSEQSEVTGIYISIYSSVHVKNILRKTEVSNIQQICIVSLMFSSASMFKFSQ